jgi:hypothetical protein
MDSCRVGLATGLVQAAGHVEPAAAHLATDVVATYEIIQRDLPVLREAVQGILAGMSGADE